MLACLGAQGSNPVLSKGRQEAGSPSEMGMGEVYTGEMYPYDFSVIQDFFFQNLKYFELGEVMPYLKCQHIDG